MSALRRASPALAAFVAVRAFCAVVLFLWSRAVGNDAHVLLSRRWDSLWYVRIVEHGYGFTAQAPDGRSLSSMAFFPLLAWLEEGLSFLTSLHPADAGLVISACASVVAAWGIFATGDALHGPRVGTLAAVLWGALPVGIVQSMAYSESLFVALASWSLYATLRERWITAGSLALLAGLTRPVGAAVTLAVIGAAVSALVAARRGRRPAVRTGRLLAGCLLSPLGAAAYVLWVGAQRGHLFGYFEVQGEWGNGFDAGWSFASFVVANTLAPPHVTGLALAAGVLGVLWLYRLTVRQRQPAFLLTYTGVIVVLALGAEAYFGSKPRLLLPAFPLLYPVAAALARLRPRAARSVLLGAAVLSAAYGAVWLGGSGPP
ncbi:MULTISPECIES: hypothetical protein [Streptomyces]|uniref:hypothetical protein n=1 Tax=Streptomyces TaxID=1883 RepID=UPI00224908F2|nr:hypothetical protein [Streptomyces sp. JHD 1]MCX2969694.1 hypothetical protein [Streptomyces sp. JHD 1]